MPAAAPWTSPVWTWPPADLAAATSVDAEEWRDELPQIEEWFATIGEQLPAGMHDELDALRLRLG